MDATIQLADAATININGNMDSLGLGWDVTGPSPLPGFVIIVIIKTPSDWPDNQEFTLSIRLVDSNGEVVKQSGTPSAQVVVQINGRVPPADSRPPGMPGGFATLANVAPGLILEPGKYEWVASVGEEEWRKAFYVRARADEFKPQARVLDPQQ